MFNLIMLKWVILFECERGDLLFFEADQGKYALWEGEVLNALFWSSTKSLLSRYGLSRQKVERFHLIKTFTTRNLDCDKRFNSSNGSRNKLKSGMKPSEIESFFLGIFFRH